MKNRKRLVPFLAGGVVTGGVLLGVGCQGNNCAALTEAADRFANVTVGPDYTRYVNGDASLDEAQKQDRLINVQTFRDAVAAHKNSGNLPD
jgi:hypothetical protein